MLLLSKTIQSNLIINLSALKIIKYFIELGVDPLSKDSIGQTALYYAAREGKFQCAKYLVELGCPLNEKDLYQQTPIYYASREGRIEIVELFIDNGADLTNEDKFVLYIV